MCREGFWSQDGSELLVSGALPEPVHEERMVEVAVSLIFIPVRQTGREWGGHPHHPARLGAEVSAFCPYVAAQGRLSRNDAMGRREYAALVL